MSESERSLQEFIEQIASESGIRKEDDFLGQVRAMFADKGIDLGEDAAPYAQAIRDAFALHSQVRETEAVTQQRLERLDAAFNTLTRTWKHLEEELAKLRVALQEREQELKARSPGAEKGKAAEERAGAFQWSALWTGPVLN